MGVRDEPICGFCLMHGVRQPLEFVPRHGFWQCPICHSKTITPNRDEEAMRQALAERDSDPHRFEKTIASTLRLKGSGHKSSKRKRKKIVRRRKSCYSAEEEAALIKKHNERLRQDANWVLVKSIIENYLTKSKTDV